MKGRRKAGVARTCLEGLRLLLPAALDVTARRSDPSPPALGAPRPPRLVKTPAADHPFLRGERAEDFERLRAVAIGKPTRVARTSRRFLSGCMRPRDDIMFGC